MSGVPSQRFTVRGFGGVDIEITAHQRSKSVWVARGTANGKPRESEGRSASAAFQAWVSAARYHHDIP